MRISDWSSDVCSSDLDVALLAAPDLVDGGAHIVVNPPARHAAQKAKGLIMGVEQHRVGLQQIGPNDEGATVAEFEVRYLELGTDPGNDRPVLAPVELERLSRSEGQRHECSSAADLLFATILIAPVPCESRNTAIGTVIAKADKIGMQLFDCSLLQIGRAHV